MRNFLFHITILSYIRSLNQFRSIFFHFLCFLWANQRSLWICCVTLCGNSWLFLSQGSCFLFSKLLKSGGKSKVSFNLEFFINYLILIMKLSDVTGKSGNTFVKLTAMSIAFERRPKLSDFIGKTWKMFVKLTALFVASEGCSAACQNYGVSYHFFTSCNIIADIKRRIGNPIFYYFYHELANPS